MRYAVYIPKRENKETVWNKYFLYDFSNLSLNIIE